MINFAFFIGGTVFGAFVVAAMSAARAYDDCDMLARIECALHEISRQKNPNATVRRIARILSGGK